MLNTKFVRAHSVNVSQTPTTAMRWTLKLLYEFWGFCVNGSDDLTVPGGFATSGSLNPMSASIIFPSGFQSGSTVLLASGSDGQTRDGMPFFITNNPVFASTYVGKHLVTWKSGSTSTDDSVYQITQWIDSSSVRVNVLQGGTPYSGSLHPSFTRRSQVNYRIVDFNAAANLGGYSGNDGLVLQFNGASLVNPQQVNSQCRLRLSTTNLGLTASPSGSWTPSSGSFLDPTTEVVGNWANSINGTGFISLWGAQDHLIVHSKGDWNSFASWCHIEVPARLYPQPLDPNVISFVNFSSTSLSQPRYYNDMVMLHPPDGSTRTWPSFIRSPHGDRFSGVVYATPANQLRGVTNGRYNNAFFNVFNNKFIFTDAVLGLTGVTQNFCLSRVRLRRVRFTVNIIPQFQRLGNLGEWIHVVDGVLWPWDNALLPYNLFQGGN